jgi:hypothetical protein
MLLRDRHEAVVIGVDNGHATGVVFGDPIVSLQLLGGSAVAGVPAKITVQEAGAVLEPPIHSDVVEVAAVLLPDERPDGSLVVSAALSVSELLQVAGQLVLEPVDFGLVAVLLGLLQGSSVGIDSLLVSRDLLGDRDLTELAGVELVQEAPAGERGGRRAGDWQQQDDEARGSQQMTSAKEHGGPPGVELAAED